MSPHPTSSSCAAPSVSPKDGPHLPLPWGCPGSGDRYQAGGGCPDLVLPGLHPLERPPLHLLPSRLASLFQKNMLPRLCGSSFVVSAVVSSCCPSEACWSVDREGEKSHPVPHHLHFCPLPPAWWLKHGRGSHIGTRVSFITSTCECTRPCVKGVVCALSVNSSVSLRPPARTGTSLSSA